MGKSDDSIQRRKNKAIRRKQNESSKVSTRVAAIIAAKKRRKTGKRSMCQGMCYSLPTPEDPFNDRHGHADFNGKETKKIGSSKTEHKKSSNKKSENDTMKLGETKIELAGKSGAHHDSNGLTSEDPGCPSKFLVVCLNSMETALKNDKILNPDDDKPLFIDSWGIEFWKWYTIGKDVLDSSGASPTTEQIAWITSTAADTITSKEKEGLSIDSPFLLFLVPSQEKAREVRSTCKPLKALGVHTVSVHSGSSLDHQIQGLRSCEPEFLVSTPERLLELVSSKALDISAVSSLIVDGGQTTSDYFDMILSIRHYISGNPHIMLFSDCSSSESLRFVQNLLQGSIFRVSNNASIACQSACIIQSVHVCVSEEEKLTMGLHVLDQEYGDQLHSQHSKVLFIVGKGSNTRELVTAIKSKGYSVSTGAKSTDCEVENSKVGPTVYVMTVDQIRASNISEFEVVLICKFGRSIDSYIKTLTRMSRYSVNGKLHTFLTDKDALVAAPLINILNQCGQAVPETLIHLSHSTSAMLEH